MVESFGFTESSFSAAAQASNPLGFAPKQLGVDKKTDQIDNRTKNKKIEPFFMVNRSIGLGLGSRFLNFMVNGLGLGLIDLKTDGYIYIENK